MPRFRRALCIGLGLLLLFTAAHHAFAQTPKGPPKPRDQSAIDNFQDIQIRNLQSRVEAHFAALDCNSQRFDSLVMKSPKILMFAICRNVETYLEGHRITIEIANPYSVSFAAVSGKLAYGKDWASKDVDISFPGELVSGRWNKLQVVINPSNADDLRNLHLTLEANQIRAASASP